MLSVQGGALLFQRTSGNFSYSLKILFRLHANSIYFQLSDWKDGHKASCKPAPEPTKTVTPQTSKAPYDIGHIGTASKDESRVFYSRSSH